MVQKSTPAKIIEEYCVRVYGDDHYYGGADGLCVKWIPEGTQFYINEYDGAEWLVTISDVEWITA